MEMEEGKDKIGKKDASRTNDYKNEVTMVLLTTKVLATDGRDQEAIVMIMTLNLAREKKRLLWGKKSCVDTWTKVLKMHSEERELTQKSLLLIDLIVMDTKDNVKTEAKVRLI
jgi:hypothetical protein